jgi:hypothetical protein
MRRAFRRDCRACSRGLRDPGRNGQCQRVVRRHRRAARGLPWPGSRAFSLTPASLQGYESPLAFSSLPSTGTIVTGHRALRRTYWLTVPDIAGLPGRAARTTSGAFVWGAASMITRPASPTETRRSDCVALSPSSSSTGLAKRASALARSPFGVLRGTKGTALPPGQPGVTRFSPAGPAGGSPRRRLLARRPRPLSQRSPPSASARVRTTSRCGRTSPP